MQSRRPADGLAANREVRSSKENLDSLDCEVVAEEEEYDFVNARFDSVHSRLAALELATFGVAVASDEVGRNVCLVPVSPRRRLAPLQTKLKSMFFPKKSPDHPRKSQDGTASYNSELPRSGNSSPYQSQAPSPHKAPLLGKDVPVRPPPEMPSREQLSASQLRVEFGARLDGFRFEVDEQLAGLRSSIEARPLTSPASPSLEVVRLEFGSRMDALRKEVVEQFQKISDLTAAVQKLSERPVAAASVMSALQLPVGSAGVDKVAWTTGWRAGQMDAALTSPGKKQPVPSHQAIIGPPVSSTSLGSAPSQISSASPVHHPLSAAFRSSDNSAIAEPPLAVGFSTDQALQADDLPKIPSSDVIVGHV